MNYIDIFIILLVVVMNKKISAVSFNRPQFCPTAAWDPNAIAFANRTTIGQYPLAIFVNTNNTVYAANQGTKEILVWHNGSVEPTKIIRGIFTNPSSIFVTNNEDIYVDNTIGPNGRVDRWISSRNTSVTVMNVNSSCAGLFVDINDTLYCSMNNHHQILKRWLNDTDLTTNIVAAGRGSSGSAPNELNDPHGIFVDVNFDLYVADTNNNRIQLFRLGQLNGETVAGNGLPNPTILLTGPRGIVLDAEKYLFIVDQSNHRIVGSGRDGFRCLVGCHGEGSQSNQLASPTTLSFDNSGNMFVTEQGNHRIQKFTFFKSSCALSYNQPKLCPTAAWNPNATTFANGTTVGSEPRGLFVDTNNTIYAANRVGNSILIWSNGVNMRKISYGDFVGPLHIFVTNNGDIYVTSDGSNKAVIKWTASTNTSSTVMDVSKPCWDLFVDINDTLYCSIRDNNHKVVKKYLKDSALTWNSIAAGRGSSGSAPNELNDPHGIFVDVNFDLYVADTNNNRIQLFRLGQLNGETVAGNGLPNPTILLTGPRGIVLDAEKYLFIVDQGNYRIVGSGRDGFRCLVGYAGEGSQANKLKAPIAVRFDNSGNMFVSDREINQIQKYSFLESSCETTTTITTITSTSLAIDSTISTLITSATTVHTSVAETTSFETNAMSSTSVRTITTTTDAPSFYFTPESCEHHNTSRACTILNVPCNFSQPCQNGGTCQNNISSPSRYYCLCPSQVNGTLCQNNHRPCEPNPCQNDGNCSALPDGTPNCTCEDGWEGGRCQTETNYCQPDTCQNRGVCRPLFKNYTCECLGDNYYSGRHCENMSLKIKIHKTVSKSFAFVVIIAMLSVAMFIIIMDILKYGFGIDPVRKDRQQIRRNKPTKKRKPIIQRLAYVDAPTITSSL